MGRKNGGVGNWCRNVDESAHARALKTRLDVAFRNGKRYHQLMVDDFHRWCRDADLIEKAFTDAAKAIHRAGGTIDVVETEFGDLK